MEGYAINNKGRLENNKKIKTGTCIFPFKYKGNTHNICLDTPKGQICATEINPKNRVMTKYGYCEKYNTNLKKITVKKARKSPPASKALKSTIKIKSKSPPPAKTLKRPSPPKNKSGKKRTIKIKRKVIHLKTSPQLKPYDMPSTITVKKHRWNEEFIKVLAELTDIMQRQGEPFKARAYQNAQETIMAYDGDIYSIDQLKNLPGIGKTIESKLEEYITTGTLKLLERERANPLNLLTRVYGIGPKKAEELVKAGIITIAGLREHPELLNDVQKIGLKYFEAIETRIPRSEIDSYKKLLTDIFNEIMPAGSTMEIVGSYRRGAQDSGDIDIIITNKDNDNTVMKKFMDRLIENKIIIEILSRGKTKSLTIAKLPTATTPRRVDFLYTSPSEYPFALLYFTGSKIFNTVQRHIALQMGYSLNEHGLYIMENGKKGEKVTDVFNSEQDIFDKLNMVYKEPSERIDGRSAQRKINGQIVEPTKKTMKKTALAPTALAPTPTALAQFKTQGISALQKLNEAELSDLIKQSNDAYYCNKTPIMTDNEYDILREHILERFPTNEAALTGHTQCAVQEKNKATLPYEMWSMDKIKPDTEALEKWKQTYKGPYVISCKLDGVSGLYSTEQATPKLYTRGNGIVGQDISHFIPYLNLPQIKNMTVRGEFIIKKELFKSKYANDFANSRNFVAGIINQKKPDPLRCADLSFVTYEVLKPELKPSAQMEFLNANGFSTVQNLISPTVTNQLLSDFLLKWRADYEYEIDGIICINDAIYPRKRGNPEHAFAFKMVLSDQIAEAKVLDVIWTASKDGYLKPRVHIEAIQLGGVRIEFATGFNAKFIEENRIGMGAIIRLVRSGDVIPHIIAVVKPAEQPQMPLVPYDWNSTHVDIMLKNKEDDVIVKEKNIAYFFSSLEVDGLGVGNVKKIIEAGFDSVIKILTMSEQDFLKVSGFKQKMASKIKESITEKVGKASLSEIMHATNIFGRGFGTKKFNSILIAEPTILSPEILPADKIKRLTVIDGMAKKTAEQFVMQIPVFLTFMTDANLTAKLNEPIISKVGPKDTSHPLYGKQYVMTGFRDKELIEKLETIGADQGIAVRKNTFVLLVKEVGDENSKTAEAKTLGIPVMAVAEFKAKYNL